MTTPTKTNPVIFIHGLWIHSAAWQPWIEMFESHGYSTSAPGWPGDGPTVAATRENSDALNDVGIAQMVDHYAQLIGTPEIKPVVVGHSFGGLIAQELLANGVVAAAVAIDPAAIKGAKALPFAQLKSAFPASARRTQPALGQAEQAALDAGTAWVAANYEEAET